MRRLEGSSGASGLVGKSADLRNLVRPDSIGLHHAAGGVGAVGREFPIPVGGGGVWLRIGMTFDGEFIGKGPKLLGESDQHFATVAI